MVQNSGKNKSQVILEVGAVLPLLALQAIGVPPVLIGWPRGSYSRLPRPSRSLLAGCLPGPSHGQGDAELPALPGMHAAGGLPGHLLAWDLAPLALATQ